MAIVTLACIVSYLALTFGVRTVVQIRRTGRSGFLGFAGARSPLDALGGIAFALAIALAVAAPILSLAGVSEPLVHIPAAIRLAIGLPLFLVGAIATFRAQLAMGDAWRIGVDFDERTELVHRGPFARVRNPIYTAMMGTAAALVVLLPSAAAVASLVLLVAGVEVQVRAVEEPYLVATHGRAYRDYAARVGRFVPGVGRLPGAAV